MTIRHFLTVRKTMAAGVLSLAPLALYVSADTGRPATPSVEEERALPVRSVPVQWVEGYPRTRQYTGRVEARRTADLGFERAARIIAIHVDDGDRVRKDDVLAALDTRDLRLGRAETEARRAQAAAVLEELENGPRRQTIEAARLAVNDLEAQLGLSKLKVARRKQLLERDAISEEEFDESRFDTIALEARLARARELLDELVEGTRAERIAAQAALVRQLDAQLESIDLDLEKSVVKAPFDGRVTGRRADEGRVVAPRETVLRVVESGALEVRVGLPAGERLAEGTTWKVRIDGRPYRARVRAGLPEVDRASRTRTYVLDLLDPTSLVPGQIARLEVERTVRAEGFWLPTEALVKSARGLWAVYVVRDGRVERREIDVLHAGGDHVLARGTLAESESVILGTHRVVPGQRVHIEG